MPISNEISKKITDFSTQGHHDKIVNYLKEQLNLGNTKADEIFEFAKTKTIMEPKRFVINAVTLSKLGVVVSELEDQDQKKLCVEIFKLAAKRDSSWGNHHCVSYFLNGNEAYGIKKSPKLALTYAQKAIELTKADSELKHEHKLILSQALWANQKRREAIIALLDFIEYKVNKKLVTDSYIEIEKLTQEAKQALDLCQIILNTLQSDFLNEEGEIISYEGIEALLQALEPFFESDKQLDQTVVSIVFYQACYIKAKCHEAIDEPSKAMLAYCQITDTELPVYPKAVEARAKLLKAQITRELSESSLATRDNASQASSHSDDTKPPANFILPGNITLPIRFSAKWKADSNWFHSVDEIGLKEEFEKRHKQIKQLIAAKETEIELFKEAMEETSDDKETIDRKECLKGELTCLRQTEKALKNNYKQYLQNYRQTFRRHAAESHFFNPKRSKKHKQLTKLAGKIIKQRFNCSKTTLEPVNLDGISTRLSITAERAFQEATMALTSQGSPLLGIPVARDKPWENNFSSGKTTYGPVERYQVGDTEIQSEHRADPKRQRLGDSFLPQHGTYSGNIYPFLSRLTGGDTEKEKKLTWYMLRYGKSHHPISLEELQAIYSKAEQKDVERFNRVCFLIMEKEQAQWHSATEERYQLGMTVAQARCLIMLEAGHINFEEAFKNTTLFGVYSHTGLINDPEKVAKSCQHIDDLYMAYLQNKHSTDYLAFFKKHITDSVKPKCVLTREQAHSDLKQVYGGDSDTDDEGYSSDLSLS